MCQTEGSCSRAAEVPRDGARTNPRFHLLAFTWIVPRGPPKHVRQIGENIIILMIILEVNSNSQDEQLTFVKR